MTKGTISTPFATWTMCNNTYHGMYRNYHCSIANQSKSKQFVGHKFEFSRLSYETACGSVVLDSDSDAYPVLWMLTTMHDLNSTDANARRHHHNDHVGFRYMAHRRYFESSRSLWSHCVLHLLASLAKVLKHRLNKSTSSIHLVKSAKNDGARTLMVVLFQASAMGPVTCRHQMQPTGPVAWPQEHTTNHSDLSPTLKFIRRACNKPRRPVARPDNPQKNIKQTNTDPDTSPDVRHRHTKQTKRACKTPGNLPH